LLLATLKNLKHGLHETSVGRWKVNERLFRGRELFGKTVGFVGFGRIGRNVFKWCKSFGALPKRIYDPRTVKGGKLEDIFDYSDIVVVCCSLTQETEGMIGYDLLKRLKENAVLVNTSRGEVLVAKDLERILLERPDISVGLDVLAGEVHGTHLASPLLRMNNVIVTPHMAGVTCESQEKAAQIALKLLQTLQLDITCSKIE